METPIKKNESKLSIYNDGIKISKYIGKCLNIKKDTGRDTIILQNCEVDELYISFTNFESLKVYNSQIKEIKLLRFDGKYVIIELLDLPMNFILENRKRPCIVYID